LCRELARLGLLVEIRDARPAVSARTGSSSSRVWVTVNPSGRLFTWRRDDIDRHPVDDPAGAAAHILEYIKLREHGDDDGTFPSAEVTYARAPD
jgi:hypothetical protein